MKQMHETGRKAGRITRRALQTVLVLYTLFITALYFGPRFMPLSDRGHRCFTVPNETAARDIMKMLAVVKGPGELFTFDIGPIHQTLWDDGDTVLIWFDQVFLDRKIPGDAISIVVDNPLEAAQIGAGLLQGKGYTTRIVDDLDPDDKLVLLESSAFPSWALVFRLHAFKMGMPEKRSITQ